MKKRHQDWANLILANREPSPAVPMAPINIIAAPGFREIEDNILLYGVREGAWPPALDDAIDRLSRSTFGVVRADTVFVFPDGYHDLPDWSNEKWAVTRRYHKFEDQFETSNATDDEMVATLLKIGFDFRDERGNPLRCTKSFARQAEAAGKGIMGKMPDRTAIELGNWEKRIEQAAKDHLNRKRKG